MNSKSKAEEPCIICLNEKNSYQMRGLDCDCKYYIHQSCHIEYTNNKQKIECPICHTVSMDNPFLPQRIVHVKREDPQDSTCVKCCVGSCFCYFVAVAILGAIFG